jgi:hypothetical protein
VPAPSAGRAATATAVSSPSKRNRVVPDPWEEEAVDDEVEDEAEETDDEINEDDEYQAESA